MDEPKAVEWREAIWGLLFVVPILVAFGFLVWLAWTYGPETDDQSWYAQPFASSNSKPNSLRVARGILAIKGEPFDEKIQVTGGRPPYRFYLKSDPPPAGVQLDSSGRLTGTFTSEANLRIRVIDADELLTVQDVWVIVVEGDTADLERESRP